MTKRFRNFILVRPPNRRRELETAVPQRHQYVSNNSDNWFSKTARQGVDRDGNGVDDRAEGADGAGIGASRRCGRLPAGLACSPSQA